MMGMGIVPLFNFPPSPPPQNHLNHKNHSLDDGYGNCVTFFTPPPQNQNNHKNHSLDDGYGYCVLHSFASHATSSTII